MFNFNFNLFLVPCPPRRTLWSLLGDTPQGLNVAPHTYIVAFGSQGEAPSSLNCTGYATTQRSGGTAGAVPQARCEGVRAWLQAASLPTLTDVVARAEGEGGTGTGSASGGAGPGSQLAALGGRVLVYVDAEALWQSEYGEASSTSS